MKNRLLCHGIVHFLALVFFLPPSVYCEVVVASGQAPPGSATVFRQFSSLTSSGSGRMAFVGYMEGSESPCLFTLINGTVERILSASDLQSIGFQNAKTFSGLAVNAHGDTVFIAEVSAQAGAIVLLRSSELSVVCAKGDSLGGEIVSGFGEVAIDDQGAIAFTAHTRGSPPGLFRTPSWEFQGPPALIVRTGQSTAYGHLGGIRKIQYDKSGALYFLSLEQAGLAAMSAPRSLYKVSDQSEKLYDVSHSNSLASIQRRAPWKGIQEFEIDSLGTVYLLVDCDLNGAESRALIKFDQSNTSEEVLSVGAEGNALMLLLRGDQPALLKSDGRQWAVSQVANTGLVIEWNLVSSPGTELERALQIASDGSQIYALFMASDGQGGGKELIIKATR